MLKKWLYPDTNRVAQAASESGQAFLDNILAERGIAPTERQRYLKSDPTQLLKPDSIPQLTQACERIQEAVLKKQFILIYGDYDCDGITGAAILAGALKNLGARFEAYIPDRQKDGYGVQHKVLKQYLKRDVALLITVDNGLAAHAEIADLKERGVDTIVVDHHQPKHVLPPAVLVGVVDGQPALDHAACGLAFMLAWGLVGWIQAEPLLDLVAIGTIADMAPLTHDNRILVSLGLKRLSTTSHTGLRALLQSAGIEHDLNSSDVAYQIAPRLNAAGRIASATEAYRLLVTTQDIEAQNLAKLLNESNTQRRHMEREAFKEAVHEVEAGHHFKDQPIIVVKRDTWHEGIVGIIAQRMVERYHRPCVAIALKAGMGKGSGRSIPKFSLLSLLNHCASFFDRFGGHAAACGVTLKEENIDAFQKEVNRVALAQLKPEHLEAELKIEREMQLNDWRPEFMQALQQMEPFGCGNPYPVFVTRNLKVVSEEQPLASYGVSFEVEGDGCRASVISYKRRFRLKVGQRLDLAYVPDAHLVSGTLQLRLEDMRLVF